MARESRRAGRLVGQQKLRGSDQSPRHRRALLFAAGDLVRVLGQQFVDAQLARQRLDEQRHVVGGHALEHQRKVDVVAHAEGVQQIELLKHKAEIVAAEGGQLLFRDVGQLAVAQPDLAAGGLVQRRQYVEKRRLARAALAHDGDVLALLYGKGNVGQSLYVMRAKARGIHLFQIVRPKNGHVGETSLRRCIQHSTPQRPLP